MASRNWKRKQALETEVKELYATITIGGTGAPTLTTGYGIASITRTSAGLYVLTLTDYYSALKSFSVVHVNSTAEDLKFQVKTNGISSSSKSITFFTLAVGTATDPTSGDVLLVKIEVKNSTAI